MINSEYPINHNSNSGPLNPPEGGLNCFFKFSNFICIFLFSSLFFLLTGCEDKVQFPEHIKTIQIVSPVLITTLEPYDPVTRQNYPLVPPEYSIHNADDQAFIEQFTSQLVSSLNKKTSLKWLMPQSFLFNMSKTLEIPEGTPLDQADAFATFRIQYFIESNFEEKDPTEIHSTYWRSHLSRVDASTLWAQIELIIRDQSGELLAHRYFSASSYAGNIRVRMSDIVENKKTQSRLHQRANTVLTESIMRALSPLP